MMRPFTSRPRAHALAAPLLTLLAGCATTPLDADRHPIRASFRDWYYRTLRRESYEQRETRLGDVSSHSEQQRALERWGAMQRAKGDPTLVHSQPGVAPEATE